jgi:hypothetical protein
VALWDDLRAGEITRISAGHESAWRMSGDLDESFIAIGHEVRRGLSPAQAKWGLAASRQRLVDAITAASERGLDRSRYGEAGLLSVHHALHAGWIRRWRSEQHI